MTDIAINEALFDEVRQMRSYITFYPHRGNDDRVEVRSDGTRYSDGAIHLSREQESEIIRVRAELMGEKT